MTRKTKSSTSFGRNERAVSCSLALGKSMLIGNLFSITFQFRRMLLNVPNTKTFEIGDITLALVLHWKI